MTSTPTPEEMLLAGVDGLLRGSGAPRRVPQRVGQLLLEALAVFPDIQVAQALDHISGCVCRFEFSLDDPPQLKGTGSCWFMMPGTGYCEHLVLLLRAIREEALSGKMRPSLHGMAKLLSPPTPEDMLARLDRAIGKHSPPATSTDQWLAWRVGVEAGRLVVIPVIRGVLKNGRSGRGRQASRTSGTDLRPYARTPQDFAAVALAESEGARLLGYSRGSHSYPIPQISPPRVLTLLAGHPEIEWAEDNGPMRIERATPGLGVVEREGRYELWLSLGDRSAHDAAERYTWNDGAGAWWPHERLFCVGSWGTAAYSAVHDVLEAKVRVPEALGAALVQKLAPLRKTVGLMLPDSLRGRQIAPDYRPILVCEPIQPAGASLRVEVRPLASGQGYAPGEGDRELSAFVGDERLSTIRDVTAELESARRVMEGLALRPGNGQQWACSLRSDEEVLDLVTRLQDSRWSELQVEWPARPKLLSQSVRSMRVQIESRQDWFGVNGSEEIDGVEILLGDVLRAVRDGKRFVSLGQGKFVEIENAFRDRIARMNDIVHESRNGLQLSSVAVPLADEVFEGVEIVAPMAWKKLIRRAQQARETVPQLPAGLDATLRDYQLEGFRWLWRLAEMGVGGCLADDMGLGKTVQAIALLAHRAADGPQLVVAPTSVGFNWQRELNRFAPKLRVHDFREGDREAVVKAAGPGDVIIASYGLLRFSLEALQQITWKTLVLDEAQAFKNYETDTARAVRSLKADWKLAMTGTPLENHIGELYSLMHTVSPGLLGTWQQFVASFGRPIEKDGDKGRREALARLLRPFILRRTKGEVLRELPPRTEIRLDATLSKQERTLYETTRLATLAQLEHREDKTDPRFVVLAALTRLRQIASHARMVEPSAPKISAKQAVLMEQLDEVLDEGHTALVFSQFTTQLRLLEEELQARKIKTLYLDGGTPAAERRRLVDSFQRGDAPVFLVSLKAGGSGLNLTAADYVFLMDPWWNPAVEDQAADRAHRIGQQRPVTIVRIVATGTVEENVLSLHAAKRQLVAGVLDGADVAGKLTSDEMISLLRAGQMESGHRDSRLGESAAAV